MVKSLRVRLVPPAYTGWPEETADKNIRALVGTRLRIEGTASKPLREAVLCFEGNRRTAAALAADGLTFVVGGEGQTPLRVEKSGDYWFELTDSAGLVGGGDARGEIVAVPDQPPDRDHRAAHVEPGRHAAGGRAAADHGQGRPGVAPGRAGL